MLIMKLKFKEAMDNIGLYVPPSGYAHSLKEAFAIAGKLKFPLVVRPSFTLGGLGGGVAFNKEEFTDEDGMKVSELEGEFVSTQNVVVA